MFFSPKGNDPKKKKHINKFLAPTQSRDNPENLFMFMCFSFPENSPCVSKQCPSRWCESQRIFAGECLQTRFARHGLTSPPLREHLNNVQLMVSGGYCGGALPDTVCWTRLRNTWIAACLSYGTDYDRGLFTANFVFISRVSKIDFLEIMVRFTSVSTLW